MKVSRLINRCYCSNVCLHFYFLQRLEIFICVWPKGEVQETANANVLDKFDNGNTSYKQVHHNENEAANRFGKSISGNHDVNTNLIRARYKNINLAKVECKTSDAKYQWVLGATLGKNTVD